VIAETAAKANDHERAARAFDAALAAAGEITNPYGQVETCAKIWETAVRAGDHERAARAIDAALAMAPKLTDQSMRSMLYWSIAGDAVRHGHRDAAFAAASRTANLILQSEAYAAIAVADAEAGSIESAERAEKGIQEGSYTFRSKARAAIAQALAREKRFYEARVFCEPCERLDKLRAYTTILNEYSKRYPGSARADRLDRRAVAS
jgi:hypothetical protein